MNNGRIPVFPFTMYSPDPYFADSNATPMQGGIDITVSPMDEHMGWYSNDNPDPYDDTK